MDIHRNDGMYSISKEWTMLQTNIAIWQKDQYNRMNKQASLPRLLWVKKENTLKELHLNVFKHLRYAFAEWADWSDPNSDKQGKEGRSNLRNIIPFPYKLQDDQPMTKKERRDAGLWKQLRVQGTFEGDGGGSNTTRRSYVASYHCWGRD